MPRKPREPEQAQQSSPPSASFANAVLDSLTAHIAVLDAHGIVIAVNEAWKRFSRDNGGDGRTFYVGTDYLAVCRDAGSGGAVAEAASAGLRAMLRGEQDKLALEYPCHSASAERWFMMRGTLCAGDEGARLVIAHEDITARKQAEAVQHKTKETLRLVLEALPVGVWIMDQTGQIVHGNPAGQRIWTGARYVGPDQFGEYKGWWLSTGQPIAADEWAAARAIRNGETSIDEEIEIECFDGTHKMVLNSAMPLYDAQHRISGAVIVNQDITRRKRSEEELVRTKEALELANRELQQAVEREQLLARTDVLTGVSNRRYFYDLAGYELAVARRYGHPLAVILFDIDHFKRVNDTWGHQLGDALLKRIVELARAELRASDILARYGGEEFIVLLSNSDARQAVVVAERIRARIAADRIDAGMERIGVTISAGAAELLPQEDTLDHMIRRADQALYRAKDSGRNRTVLFAPADPVRDALRCLADSSKALPSS